MQFLKDGVQTIVLQTNQLRGYEIYGIQERAPVSWSIGATFNKNLTGIEPPNFQYVNQNQNSLLVKRQTDNTTPWGWGLTGGD